MNTPDHLLSRDGHITMLSLDRYDVGELDDRERRRLDEHLRGCGRCRERRALVSHPHVVPMAPARHDTGSVTIASLALTSAFAAAAALVLAFAPSPWPSPRVAREADDPVAGMASAYTSVAQEYSEPTQVELDVTSYAEGITISADDELGFVSVVVIADDMSDGTGGEDAGRVLDVLLPARTLVGALDVDVPSQWLGYHLVVLACVEPASIEIGDALDESGCVSRDQVVGAGLVHDS